MKDQNEHFVPENIDEQTEQLPLSSIDTTPSSRLLQDLQKFSRVEQEKDVRSLQRVWDRVSAQRTLSAATSTTDLSPNQKGVVSMQQKYKIARFTPLNLFIASFIAVLVVGGLLATVTLLLNAPHTTTDHAGTPTPTEHALKKTPAGIYLSRGNTVYHFATTGGGILWSTQLKLPSLPPQPTPVITSTPGIQNGSDQHTIDPSGGSGPTQQDISPHPLLVQNGTVFVIMFHGIVCALDANDGRQLWSTPVQESYLATRNLPVFADGILYAAGKDTLYTFDGNTGKIIKTYPISTAAFTIVDHVLYTASHNKLTAFQLPAGKQLWQSQVMDDHSQTVHSFSPAKSRTPTAVSINQATAAVVTLPHVNNGRVYVTVYTSLPFISSQVQAFDASDGHRLWQSPQLNNEIITDLTISNNALYFGAMGGPAHKYDTDGHQLWRSDVTVSGLLFQVENDTPYIAVSQYSSGTVTVSIESLDSSDGHAHPLIPNTSTQQGVAETAVVHNGILYLAQTDQLRAIQLDGQQLWSTKLQPPFPFTYPSPFGLVVVD